VSFEQVCEKWPKDGKIIWVNMRQEPVIYVNGNPVCARPPNKIGEYAELGNVTRENDSTRLDRFAAAEALFGSAKRCRLVERRSFKSG